MSRSGYSEDCSNWEMIKWRGAVNSAIKGKRGQVLLKNMLLALDLMVEKKLIKNELIARDGSCCALGAVAIHENIDVSIVDPGDSLTVSFAFDIAESLAKEIVYINDEDFYINESSESRWIRVRKWVCDNIVK